MTTEFLEELVHSPNLLPAEHKAAAQLLQMMGTTKKDENKGDVDLDILLAPHMVSHALLDLFNLGKNNMSIYI